MNETLKGVIERITYHNDETGYTVARLQTEEGRLVTVVGKMVGINVGAAVELSGVWSNHPQYGPQFKAESFRTALPATVAGIEK
ncbi:MAG: ATP-dependent RecD-like DNA helicase, partial [Chloroflexi bacterium]|nr:ATP-dependent RecD-like DNA helicase [Chloroflexota bacterium]